MKQLELANRLREGLARHASEVEASAAAKHFDVSVISENLVLGLLKALLDLKNLRNLNAAEKVNFAGLDLIDDIARVGVQVTATPTLEKIKETIATCKRHGIDARIDRLIIYVLTRRQDSYSQRAIDNLKSSVSFSVKRDVLDFRSLSSIAGTADPIQLSAAVEVLESYTKGVPSSLDVTKFDPPSGPGEDVSVNLLELYVPSRIYVADLIDQAKFTGGRRKGQRQAVRRFANELGVRLPSDYMVSEGRLITFHALDQANHPFVKLVDPGTVTPLESQEFWTIDIDHEMVFKGLLRFSVQQKLYKHSVRWFNEEGIFAFLPKDNPDLRQESWTGKVRATRSVFVRKLNRKDETKTFICKHLAFAVDFMITASGWHVALAPDWYFSYGEDFRKSLYADKSLAWLKRKETNRIVFDHFRFLSEWLKELDQSDLFDSGPQSAPTVTFGDVVVLPGHPRLEDDAWLPVRSPATDADADDVASLFEDL